METSENNKLIEEFMGYNLKEFKLNTTPLTENSIKLNNYYFDTINNKVFKCTRTAFPLVIIQDTENYHSANIKNCREVVYDDLKFHSDWNWLMEAVHKCLSLSKKENLSGWEEGFLDSFLSKDINCMYSETIRFIKWYNQQNK